MKSICDREISTQNNSVSMTKIIATSIAALLIASLLLSSTSYATSSTTTTPIKHLVVIFQENVSYDHYFGTYPNAANPVGEPQFKPSGNTPSANGLTSALLTSNTNTANPFRLDRTVGQLITCDQDHEYKAEQEAYDGGLLDMFTQKTGVGQVNKDGTITCPSGSVTTNGNLTMGYYDGNTVTALWNYAQNFAMNDNSYSTTFGPSTPGMLNLVAGQTHGATPSNVAGNTANGSVIGDPDGAYDDCSSPNKVNHVWTECRRSPQCQRHYMGMVPRRICTIKTI
jgi:phospholipase C